MERLIYKLNNNIEIVFDSGTFDRWCVYIKKPGVKRVPPNDVDYFRFFKSLPDKLKVYNDFVRIYDATPTYKEKQEPNEKMGAGYDSLVDRIVLRLIEEIALDYAEDVKCSLIGCFVVIYAGMIAENNKVHTLLGKRVKRLGMHQLLVEDYKPEIAANFSRGLSWRELDEKMLDLDF